jgi:Protein of unknown function (DUF3035)
MGGLKGEKVRRGLGLVMVAILALGGCARGSVQQALGLGKRAPDEFAVVKRAPLIVPPEYDLRPPDPGAPRPNIGRTADQARIAMTGSGEAPSSAAQILGTAAPSTAAPSVANAPGATARSNGVATGSVGAAAVADDLLAAGTRAPATGTTTAAPQTPGTAVGAAVPVAAHGETRGELALVSLAGGDQADPAIRRAIAEENQALADVEASLFTRVVKWREPSTLGATIDAPAEAQRLRGNQIAGRAPTEGDTPTVVNRRQSALQGFLGDIF